MTRPSTYAGKTAYHGDVAVNYDRDRVGEPVWQKEQAWVETWARGVPSGAKVLDVPAGTGRFIGIFRARGAQVQAVDISEDMLAALRGQWAPDGATVVVEQGDAEALRHGDGAFDFAICWRLFHLVPADVAERVLRELARVCRGEIVVEVFGVEAGGPARLAWSALKRKVRTWLPRRSAGAKPWSHITNFVHNEPALRAMMARSGLRVVRVETLTDYEGRPARVFVLRREGSQA